MTYGYCAYHEIECDYEGSCIDCPHNTVEDTEWFRQDEKQAGCSNCRDCYCDKNSSARCSRCDDNFNLWIPPCWLEEWLNSFDTSSAIKCFEAVNILKEQIERSEDRE